MTDSCQSLPSPPASAVRVPLVVFPSRPSVPVSLAAPSPGQSQTRRQSAAFAVSQSQTTRQSVGVRGQPIADDDTISRRTRSANRRRRYNQWRTVSQAQTARQPAE